MARELVLERRGLPLKHGIGGNADGVLDVEKLAELIKKRHGEPGIGTQFDAHPWEGLEQAAKQT